MGSLCFLLFISFFFFPSLLSVACTLLLPSFALGMCSCAVSSCQTVFCFKPLAPSFTDTSHFHIYVLRPSLPPSLTFIHLSVSLRPAAFPSSASYFLLSRLSGLSISPHLPPPLSLSPSVSPEFTPLLHLSLFHLYPLSALPTPASPPHALISLLSLTFILSASPHLACEFSFPTQPLEIACSV